MGGGGRNPKPLNFTHSPTQLDNIFQFFNLSVSDLEPPLPEEEEEEEEEEDESVPLPATIPLTGFACKRRPCILLFDSLGGGSRNKVRACENRRLNFVSCRSLGQKDVLNLVNIGIIAKVQLCVNMPYN